MLRLPLLLLGVYLVTEEPFRDLERQVDVFKGHPRTLVELVKNMSFATADELDDGTGPPRSLPPSP